MEEAEMTQEAEAEAPKPTKARRSKVAKTGARKKTMKRETNGDAGEFHSVRLTDECMKKVNKLRGQIMVDEGTNPSTSEVIEHAVENALP